MGTGEGAADVLGFITGEAGFRVSQENTFPLF